MKRLFFFILFFVPVVFYADTIIPRAGTSSQISTTIGNNNELAIDIEQKALVIFDGKKKGGYYIAGATVTVVNTYNTYTTSNTITNNYTINYYTYTDTTTIWNNFSGFLFPSDSYPVATNFGLWELMMDGSVQPGLLNQNDKYWEISGTRIIPKN